MSDTGELDSLLINSLLDLDDAAKRIDSLGDQIWEQICDLIRAWAFDRLWKVEETRDGIRLGPPAWFPRDGATAWFYVDFGPDDSDQGGAGERYFYLSRYVGVGGGKLCIWLNQKVVSLKVWKTLAKTYAERMAPLGFSLSDDGSFYTDCTLNARDVASALAEHRLEAAMLPVQEALNRVAEASTLFIEMLEGAKGQ